MPIISKLGRKTWPGRLVTLIMYVTLTILGASMVIPFLMTCASSICNDYDYERYLPVPRYLSSRDDRFVKALVPYFNTYPKWYEQMSARFEAMPEHWTTWRDIGRVPEITDEFAETYLTPPRGNVQENTGLVAADYADFMDTYPMLDCLSTVADIDAATFLANRYERVWAAEKPKEAAKAAKFERRHQALQLLSKTWQVPLPNFYLLGFERNEMRQPYWQQSWFPTTDNAKYQDFLLVKKAALYHVFTPGMAGRWESWAKKQYPGEDVPSLVELVDADDSSPWLARFHTFKRDLAPAAPTMPLAMRVIWRNYLETEDAREITHITGTDPFTIDTWNKLADTSYTHINQMPFPPPEDSTPVVRQLWDNFVTTRYPIRLTTIEVTPDVVNQYHTFLKERFKTLAYANQMLGSNATAWTDFQLTATPPMAADQVKIQAVWIDFVKNLPLEHRQLHSGEHAYQAFLLQRYGDLAGVNKAYGWNLHHIEEAFPPFAQAYTVTFQHNEWALSLQPIRKNYSLIITFLLERGRAIFVTCVLIFLAILVTLTVNPMAAYALSRFSMRSKDKIILFLLATMAFPAMVSAIPAYLLMRDLGLLNTFFALVLPSAANGMSIFILKGFFDSLPQELYEAATIDGAREWQIFLVITMPMMKPILAINALNAFIAAYNGWQWALIICQDKDMWTLSVWMYQVSQWWERDYPWLVMAGFVIVSIPTLLVFAFCQKIIMRGIIVPSMK